MTVDARRSPRTKTSFAATLVSNGGGVEQVRIVTDLSESGLFVTSLNSARIGDLFLVLLKNPGLGESQVLAARVKRVDSRGCGLVFDHLQPHEQLFLFELIHPNWDGRDLLEGVILHGILENTADLAACMRLTSLLSSNYRYVNRASKSVARMEPVGAN
jgi:hypothetical protein